MSCFGTHSNTELHSQVRAVLGRLRLSMQDVTAQYDAMRHRDFHGGSRGEREPDATRCVDTVPELAQRVADKLAFLEPKVGFLNELLQFAKDMTDEHMRQTVTDECTLFLREIEKMKKHPLMQPRESAAPPFEQLT